MPSSPAGEDEAQDVPAVIDTYTSTRLHTVSCDVHGFQNLSHKVHGLRASESHSSLFGSNGQPILAGAAGCRGLTFVYHLDWTCKQ